MKNVLQKITEGVLAGIMIVIGCTVYLACENKVFGAIFFSVALITICFKGFSLYTGKIGLMTIKNFKSDFTALTLGLLGNVIATFLFGLLISVALPKLQTVAQTAVSLKLKESFIEALIRAIFCGILMYVAVSVYREKNSLAGIVFCVPVFILCGFEHSIANMGYFAIARVIDLQSFGYIWIIILGNTIGGLLFPILSLLRKENKNSKSEATNG